MILHALEVDAWNGAAVETLRFGTKTLVTPAPDNRVYLGCISDLGMLEVSIFDGGGTLGNPSASLGSIVLDNVDGKLDAYLGYGFDGRAYRLYELQEGAQSLTGARLLASGLLAGIDTSDALYSLRLRLRDARAALETQLLTARYAGTTTDGTIQTFEGDETLKDQIKPRVFGSVVNMLPRQANRFLNVWQVSDGPVASIAVYDGGVPLTIAGDFPTPAAMLAANIAGDATQRVATCLAAGLFRLDDAPQAQITADVVEGATAADRRTGAIVERLLALAGATAVDTPSLENLDFDVTAEIGLLVDTDADALTVIADALTSVGAALIPLADGTFTVVRVTAPAGTPVATFTLRTIDEIGSIALAKGPTEEGEGVPVHQVELTWGRVWQAQGEGDLVGGVTAFRRAYVKEATRKIVVESAAIKAAHPLSQKLTFDTLFATQADAQAEAARRFAIYSVRRDYLAIAVSEPESRGVMLGDVIRLTVPRFGWQAGKLFLVVGRSDDFTKRTVTLSIWG